VRPHCAAFSSFPRASALDIDHPTCREPRAARRWRGVRCTDSSSISPWSRIRRKASYLNMGLYTRDDFKAVRRLLPCGSCHLRALHGGQPRVDLLVYFITNSAKSIEAFLFGPLRLSRVLERPSQRFRGKRKNRRAVIFRRPAQNNRIMYCFTPQETSQVLGSQSFSIDSTLSQNMLGHWMNLRRPQTGTTGLEKITGPISEERLSHLCASGIIGAKEKDGFHDVCSEG